MPRLPGMRLILVAALAAVVLAPSAPLQAQEPTFHGTLKIRPAFGAIDKVYGTGSLRVPSWDFFLISDSNGIAPDKEPVIIAIGESESLVIPVGQVKASRNGKKFTFRNPGVLRGIRLFQLRRLKTDSNGIQRYRVRFTLAGIDLSSLTISFPTCTAFAVIVGDDDGFEGVWLDRPGGFNGSKVKTAGVCPPPDWPWA